MSFPHLDRLTHTHGGSSNLAIGGVLAFSSFLVCWVYNRSSQSTLDRARLAARSVDPNRPCRWRLDADSSASLMLPDGRRLGYAEYGSPNGRPIITIHGLPGCRLEAAVNDGMFERAGARLIAVDRPGIGLSSPNPNSTVLDHAKDIHLMAEYLELREYAVWGSSAGGPYALACAASAPSDKLKAVAVVCGLGSPDMSSGGMLWFVLNGFKLGYHLFPALLRWFISRDPVTRLDIDDETRLKLLQQQIKVTDKTHPRDAQVLSQDNVEDDLRLYSRGHREIYARGPNGFMEAAYPLTKNWGFRLEDVHESLPIHLWYGSYDHIAPVAHGKEIANRLNRAKELRIKDETHMSITANWKQQVLYDLLAAM